MDMAAESEKELVQLQKRLAELSRKSYEHNFTGCRRRIGGMIMN